jgi:hypothetical protein
VARRVRRSEDGGGQSKLYGTVSSHVSIIESCFKGGSISNTYATEWTIVPRNVERWRLETREKSKGSLVWMASEGIKVLTT